MAAFVPGLLLIPMLMVYVAICALFFARAYPIGESVTFVDPIRARSELLPLAVLIGGAMGCMYLGLVPLAEAAAIGCALGAIMSLIWATLQGAALRPHFTRSWSQRAA